MISEDKLKRALNGTFIKYLPNADRFVVVEVPRDFIPLHRSACDFVPDPERKIKYGARKTTNKFMNPTPEQAAVIEDLCRREYSQKAILAELKASGHRVAQRAIVEICWKVKGKK